MQVHESGGDESHVAGVSLSQLQQQLVGLVATLGPTALTVVRPGKGSSGVSGVSDIGVVGSVICKQPL